MFDWFKKPDYTNVVKFPEKIPYVTPPKKEEETQTFYRIGVTNNSRVSFQVGYSELTMSKLGVKHLIEQLELFMDQLPEEQHEERE